MSIHLEIFLRVIGLFLSVFFTTKWTSNSKPKYDTFILSVVVILAIWLNYR